MNLTSPRPHPIRSLGFWLAVLLALSQLVNSVRVLFGPVDYGTYMGLPLAADADVSWIYVYALRAAFLGSFAGFLLWTAQYRVLSQMALIAVLMPIGDFYLVWQAHGTAPTLVRHALIGVILLAAWFSLERLARRNG